MRKTESYLMEGTEETLRLEVKTVPDEVRSQALWCGIRLGMRVSNNEGPPTTPEYRG